MAAAPNFWIRWRVRVGYPVAIAYLAFAKPTVRSLIIGGIVGAIGLVIRAWAAGHLRKHEALATGGPYAFTRNPLYFGSVVLAAGFVVIGWSIWAGIIVAAYLALFYPAVMRREEAELQAHYGDDFTEYARRVPLFWPRLIGGSRAGVRESFSSQLYLRNREYQAAIGFLFGLALLWAKMNWVH
ncbi:MAG: isoprenylcysteine carboxylmethyltransferase family protein [Candidatus Acidiferrales bacterium]